MEARVLNDCLLNGRYLRAGECVTVDMEPDKLPECLEAVKKAGGKRKNASGAAGESQEEGGTGAERPKF